MAPIKFEEHVKERLDERKIQPSAGSWDQLSSRLNKDSNKSSGKKWWLSAVAAVAILLIASTFFLNQNQQIQDNPIVESPVEENIEDSSEKVEFEQPVQLVSEETKVENETLNTKTEKNASEIQTVAPQKTGIEDERLVSNTENNRKSVESISVDSESKKDKLNSEISGKVSELMAKISSVEKKAGISLTDAEVDALLAQAVTEIDGTGEQVSSEKISADALLADVEEEVYESFKEKVFEIVKTGYQKAAVAVSNKLENNQ